MEGYDFADALFVCNFGIDSGPIGGVRRSQSEDWLEEITDLP
jgi:hypothetical protein